VSELIVWENLDINRYVLRNPVTQTDSVKHYNPKQEAVVDNFKENGVDLDTKEKMPLLEWLANNYKQFGCALNFITNKSQEGSQFCKGFGGIGGLLRYQVDFASMEEIDDDFGQDD